MKIIVISDTHDRRDPMEQLLTLPEVKNADWLIHCGDIGYDDEWLRYAFRGAVTIVAGNCDYGSNLPRETVVEREGVSFFITHGNRYLSAGIDRLAYRAEELGCGVVLFGHTHTPLVLKEDGILFVNPGSLTMPRQADRRRTYAVLTEKDGEWDAEIRELPR